MTHVEFPAVIPTDMPRQSVGRSTRARRVALHVGVWVLLAIVVAVSVRAGFQLRRWTWETTTPIRFSGDINRGYNWGREAAERGYFNLYEKMAAQESHWGNWLDYAPLRLAVMSGWGHWTKTHFPDSTGWQPGWEFNKFVLLFNTGMELMGATCAFLLTRLWLVRARGSGRPFTGWAAGLTAGLLFWFNPATVLSAHGWPTWDMWIMPMYLLAVLLASYDRWFAAGLVVAIGAMFKGQQLAVATIFVLWPLVLWRFDAILKWAAGLLFGIGVLASVWLVTYVPADALAAMRATQESMNRPWITSRLTLPDRVVDVPAITWVASLLLIAIAAPFILARWAPARMQALPVAEATAAANVPVRHRSRPTRLRQAQAMFADRRSLVPALVLGIITLLLALWPWLLERNREQWRTGLLFATAVAVVVVMVRPRHGWMAGAGIAGASLLLCSTLFHGSDAWWICGWKYGTFHWPWMYMGTTSNLPGLLVNRFGWEHKDTTVQVFQLPADVLLGYPQFAIDVTIKQLLAAIYTVLLAVCGIGIGLQARRRDPRILVALTAPWLMFFCFPVQIHERYLLYAAGIAAITAGAGVGPALLGVMLSAFTWIMTMHVMIGSQGHRGTSAFGERLADAFPALFDSSIGPTLQRFIVNTHPDIAWAILLCAAIYLYLALAPSRGRKNDQLIEPV
jgi:hypothetical protein